MASPQRKALGPALDGIQLHDDDIPILHQVKIHFAFKLHTAAKPNRALLDLAVSGLTSLCTAQCGSPSNFMSAGFGYLNVMKCSGMFHTATQNHSEVHAIDPNWAAEAHHCHYKRKDTWQHFHVSWINVDYGGLGRSVSVKVVLRPRWVNGTVFRFRGQVMRNAFAALMKTQRNPVDELLRLKTSIESKASSSSDIAMRNLMLSLKTFVAALNPGKAIKLKTSLDPVANTSRAKAEQVRVCDIMKGTGMPLSTRPPKSKQEQSKNSGDAHTKETNGPLRVQQQNASQPLTGPTKPDGSPHVDSDDDIDDEYLPLAQTRPSHASVYNSKKWKTRPALPPKISKAIGASSIDSDSDDEPLASRRPSKHLKSRTTPQSVYPTPPATPETPQAAMQPLRTFRTLSTPYAFDSPSASFFPLDKVRKQTPSRTANHTEDRATSSPSPGHVLPIFRPGAQPQSLITPCPSEVNNRCIGMKRSAPNPDNITRPLSSFKKPRFEGTAPQSMVKTTPAYMPQSKATDSKVYTPRNLPTPTELRGYLQTIRDEVLANPSVWDTLSAGTQWELKREYPAFGIMNLS